jgi:16S rRNA (adenine1518-N6/adenine1519-N6)-dimethyltransferase
MGRKLGQHFLVSPAIVERIVALAAVQPGEPVLEIGPGRGALTERLLAAGARVAAIEIDAELAAALQARWASQPRFRLTVGDVLKTPLDAAALFGAGTAHTDTAHIGTSPTGTAYPDTAYAVIANLPYYLTTPLLFRFIRERRRFSRLLLMVQREVAERLAASPEDGHAYGSLSIAGQTAFSVRLVLRVPAGAFHPRPKVESAVVELRPLPAVWEPKAEAGFLEHVKGLFSQRRKRLAGTLARARPAWPADRLAAASERLGDRRPEALAPAEHLALYALLRGLSVPGPLSGHPPSLGPPAMQD